MIDWFIVVMISFVTLLVFRSIISGAPGLWYLANLVGIWLYVAGMESSSTQATFGKQALGIVVTDQNGEQISFGRATGRHFGKWISALIINIGFLMATFTPRKQALHDMMAGCLVLNKLARNDFDMSAIDRERQGY